MRIVNHDDAEKNCLTCANSFIRDDFDYVDRLWCVEKNKVVEEDSVCDEWN